MGLFELRVVAWYTRLGLVRNGGRGLVKTGHEEQHLFQDRQAQGVHSDLIDSLDRSIRFPSAVAHRGLGLLDRLVRAELRILSDVQLCI